MQQNKIISAISIIACILLIVVIMLAAFAQDYLPFFGLSVTICTMAAMNLLSLILLMAFMQTPPLGPKWRLFCLFASFLTMAQSWFIMMNT